MKFKHKVKVDQCLKNSESLRNSNKRIVSSIALYENFS